MALPSHDGPERVSFERCDHGEQRVTLTENLLHAGAVHSCSGDCSCHLPA